MRVAPVSSCNFNLMNKKNSASVGFGHVYSKAVDVFRHSCEGYKIKYTYKANDSSHEHPIKEESYVLFEEEKNGKKFLTDGQVQRLENLVLRMANLRKSILCGFDLEPFVNYSDELSLLCMNKGNRVLLEPPKDENFKLKKGDIEGNFDKFEKIVEWAEEIEKTDIPDIEPHSKKTKQGLDRHRIEDRYKHIYLSTYRAPKVMY